MNAVADTPPAALPAGAALGLIEVAGFAASLAAIDAMEKAADIAVLQVELNDLYGTSIRIAGSAAGVETALAAGQSAAENVAASTVVNRIARPSPTGTAAWTAKIEVNPLIEQAVVHQPSVASRQQSQEPPLADTQTQAIGIIETQGFTAVIEAIDTACKAAAVEVIGREKLGGGYIAIIIEGDTAAVQAAVNAGREKVNGLGKLIAAHVIPRPSASVRRLIQR